MPDDADPSLDPTLAPDAHRPDAGGSAASILHRLSRVIGERPSITLRGGGEDDASKGRASGKYVIAGELGRGGVGAVFRGHDTDLGRDVAMKFLHERYRDDPAIVQRFVEEAQIGGQLQHPGIVPVYDLGMDAGQPFFAMKLVKGDTLARLLAERPDAAAELPRFLAVFEDVCQTMAYAHARGVVHRDLKPANIMIGRFGEVQVVDWGMGKVLQTDEPEAPAPATASHASIVATIRSGDDSTRSLVGSVMGTPAYMPPEQARGDVAAMDERSDVFALGAILCEILTGAPPYTGSAVDVLAMAAMARLDDAFARLDACGADPELIDLARRCLIPAPAARPRNAGVVAEIVHQHLVSVQSRAAEARVEAAEATVRAEGLRRAQRLGLGLTAAITAGLVVSLWLWREASSSAEREAMARADAVAAAEAARRNESVAREQTAIAERELGRAVEMKSLLSNMLASVSPERARTADTTLLVELLDTAAERIARGEIRDRLVAAELQTLIGDVYEAVGRPELADPHVTAALATRRTELGEGDQATLATLQILTKVRRGQGRLAEAEQLVRQGIDTAIAALGDRHPVTIGLRTNLAVFVEAQGRLIEAAELQGQLLQQNREVFGREHDNTFTTELNMSTVLSKLNRTTEAEALLDELIATMRRVKGEDSPLLALAISNLAVIHENTERFEEARALFAEALSVQRRTIGDRHPDTLKTLGNLGVNLDRAGRHREAESHKRSVYEAQLALRGADHPDTLLAQLNLACAITNQRRAAEAKPMFEEVLAAFVRIEGEDSNGALLAMTNLGNVHLQIGQAGIAEKLLADVVARRRRVTGATANATCNAIVCLAEAHQFAGHASQAVELLNEALQVQREQLGADHRCTLTTLARLGGLLVDLEQTGPAEPLLREALETWRQHPRFDPALRGSTLAKLATVATTKNDMDTAQQLFAEALATVRAVRGERHEEVARIQGSQGMVCLMQGDFEAAAELLSTAIEVIEGRSGVDSPEVMAYQSNLASAYMALGDLASAAKILEQQIPRFAALHGTESPNYGAMVTNLGLTLLQDGRPAEAAAQFEVSLPLKRRTLGLGHEWTQNAINGLTQAYLQLDRRADAVAVQRELVAFHVEQATMTSAAPALRNDVAWLLLTHELEDLHDPARALALATSACERGEQQQAADLWGWLDTLALAQHRTGDDAAAAKTMRRALERMPATAPKSERARMQQRLLDYDTAAGR